LFLKTNQVTSAIPFGCEAKGCTVDDGLVAPGSSGICCS
jgi:hypothetical protein